MLQPAPRPKCVYFYNGTGNQPERKILRLSEAFAGEGDIEVIVTMLNINYGKNRELMTVCEPLSEYAWLVEAIRGNQRTMKNLEAAIDAAIDEMPDEFVIKRFLLQNRAEVKGMFLTEYDQEKVLSQQRRDSMKQGIELANERVATDMLKGGEPLEKIVMYSRLAEDAIRKLANNLGMGIV